MKICVGASSQMSTTSTTSTTKKYITCRISSWHAYTVWYTTSSISRVVRTFSVIEDEVVVLEVTRGTSTASADVEWPPDQSDAVM